MENNKHHIDKFLKEQMEKLPVEFNEAHWADAERRLDGEEKRRKPFFLLFFGLVLLIGMGITASKYVGQSDKTKNSFTKTKSHETNNRQQATEEQDASNENEMVASDLTNSNTRTEQGASQSDYSSEESSTPRTSKKATAYTADMPNENELERQTRRNERKMARSAKKARESERRAAKKTVASRNSLEDSAPSLASPTKQKQNTGDPTVAKRSTEQTLGDNENATAEVQNKRSDKSPRTATIPVAQNAADQKPPKKKLRIYKSLEEYQALNPRYVAGLENYTPVRSVIPLGERVSDSIRAVVAAQNKKASKTTVPKANAQKPKQPFVQQPSSFYMLAGLGLGRGFKGADGTPAAYSLSPSLGAGYQLNFSDRMSIYLSAYMNYISHLNIKETATNVTYSFDRDSSLISVTRKNLLQLNVPIDFAYKLTPKHTVYGGLGLSLGLNTVSLYEDSKQGGSERQFGYTSGLRFMDVNTTIGYEYNIVPKLSLGIFYQQGFFDMTKNDYFNNGNNDKNSRGGLRLRYKFIR